MKENENKLEIISLSKEEIRNFIVAIENILIPSMNKHRLVRWSSIYTLDDISEIRIDGNQYLRNRFCVAFQNDESKQMTFALDFGKINEMERESYKQIAVSCWYNQDKLYSMESSIDVSFITQRHDSGHKHSPMLDYKVKPKPTEDNNKTYINTSDFEPVNEGNY